MKLHKCTHSARGSALILASVFVSCSATPGGTAEDGWTSEERERIGVVRRVCPSIVHIEALVVSQTGEGGDPGEAGEQLGSGVAWDHAGHIVTNLHVVRGSDAVRVLLRDGSSWPATVVGTDPALDIAVLRIAAPGDSLTPALVEPDAQLAVGQTAMAFGNPFGLDHTLTVGVVSALGRELRTESGETMHGLVQTDAAINPGSSGGALIDSRGRLIGINVALLSPNGAFAGIGYAVPIQVVAPVVQRILGGRSPH